IALFREIREAANAGMAKVGLGHELSTDAKSGTGTLAGNYAEHVSDEHKEGVSEGVSESMQQGLTVPWWGYTRGWDRVKTNEIPRFNLKCRPPIDLEKKSKTYVLVNQVLASAKRTIDPSQIEDEFQVRTIELAAAPGANDESDPEVDPKKAVKKKPPVKAKRITAAAKKEPRIKTEEDLAAVSRGLLQKAAQEFTAQVSAVFNSAESLEAGVDALWEGYTTLDPNRIASALRDVTMTAELIAEAEAQEDVA
ncbi:MAG TPA: DUF935 family protein, partial [Thermoanaerobaculia bacterium]|nr:DUF935 family protein [Thermoanaerobaculia bacterium]